MPHGKQSEKKSSSQRQEQKQLADIFAILDGGKAPKEVTRHVQTASARISMEEKTEGKEVFYPKKERHQSPQATAGDILVPRAHQSRRNSLLQTFTGFFNRTYEPSKALIAYLNTMAMSIDDLNTLSIENLDMANKSIHAETLDQLLAQGFWGNFLRFFVWFPESFKLAAFWAMKMSGVTQDRDNPNVHSEISLTILVKGKPVDQQKALDKQQQIISIGSVSTRSHMGPAELVSELATQDEIPLACSNHHIRENRPDFAHQPIIFAKYFDDRIWPKSRGMPFTDRRILANIYMVESGLNGARFFRRVWAVTVLTFLSMDIATYFSQPDQRYGNTLAAILLSRSENRNMLTRLFTSSLWTPIALFSAPLLLAIWGMYFKKNHPTHAILDIKEIEAIESTFKHYVGDFQQDFLYPFLRIILPDFINKCCVFTPFPNARDGFNNLLKTLLWDGSVPADVRLRLFEAAKILLEYSSGLLKLELLSMFTEIAADIHVNDIKRLYSLGYTREDARALLYMVSDAKCVLASNANWRRNPISTLVAHYQLFKIGLPETNIAIQLLFLLVPTYGWYALGRWILNFAQGMDYAISYLREKAACEREGKSFDWMDLTQRHECTACDLPIPYKDMFTHEDCVQAWFGTNRRTVDELIDVVVGRRGHVDFSQITALKLDRQYLTDYELSRFLPVLAKHAPHLKRLDLNMTRFPSLDNCMSDKTCEPIGKSGLNAILMFLIEVHVEELSLVDQFIDSDNCDILRDILLLSKLKKLDLSYKWNYVFTNKLDSGCAVLLAEGFASSPLEVLIMRYHAIGNAGMIAFSMKRRTKNGLSRLLGLV